MKDFLKPHLKCSPTNIILHVGTSYSIINSSSVILYKLLSLKDFIHTELKQLNSLKLNSIDNSSISSEHLNSSGLHLNRYGKGKLAINLF